MRRVTTLGLCLQFGITLAGIAAIPVRAEVLEIRINGTTVPCPTQTPATNILPLGPMGGPPRLALDSFNCTVSAPGEGTFQVSGMISMSNLWASATGFDDGLALNATVQVKTFVKSTVVNLDVKESYVIPVPVGSVVSTTSVRGSCNNGVDFVGALDFFVNGARNQVLNSTTGGPVFPCPGPIVALTNGSGSGSGGLTATLENVGSVFFPAPPVDGAVSVQMTQTGFNPAVGGGGTSWLSGPPPILPPISFTVCQPYQCDDGSTENSLGITLGGAAANTSIAWMNGFTIQPGRQTISAILLTFGRPGPQRSDLTNGQPVTVYLWTAPSGNGTPYGAQVQRSTAGFTANVDTDVFNVFPITPITLPVGTHFYVGAILQQNGFQAAASVDLNSPYQDSWLRGWSPGIPPDPNHMDRNEFNQAAFVNLSATSVPGVFMIRAQ